MKALIMARGGSERVKDKNIRPFGNTTLLQHKIEQLKKLDLEVVVSSESAAILNLSLCAGATIIERPEYYARSDTPMKDVFTHLAASMSCDTILFANCTSPFIKTETLQKMRDLWYTLGVDSLNTVTPVKDFLWSWDSHKAINYDPDNQPRSQDLVDVFRLDWAAAIVKREAMEKEGRVLCKSSKFYPITEAESVDIDTETDFKTAESMFNAKD